MPLMIQAKTKLFTVLILLVLFSPLAMDIYLPAFPEMADSFSVDILQIQDTFTWFMFSLGVGQLLAGPLADKFGRRPVALGGIVLYITSAILAQISPSIEILLLARLIQGLSSGATAVTGFAAVRDSFGAKYSGRVISYLNGIICCVPALAPILGGWLTSQYGWQANFSFMIVFALVAGTVIAKNFKESCPVNSNFQGSVISVDRYMSVLCEPSFLFHSSLCMLAMSVTLAYVTTAPEWLMVKIGLTTGQFTIWFGLNAVFNIVACLIAPRFMQKLGNKKVLNIGLLLIICAGGLMIILKDTQEAWSFMFPIIISSFGYAFVLGTAAGKALAPFANEAGTAAALLGVFQMSGAGLLVSSLQRLELAAPELLIIQMWLLIPAVLLLLLKKSRQWCGY